MQAIHVRIGTQRICLRGLGIGDRHRRGYRFEQQNLIDYSTNPALHGSYTVIKIGVEVLEGAEDQRYKFFNKKLQSLMLKKPVAEQLKFASLNRAQEVKHPMKQSEKRQ